ncbi:hypothetical protein [Christiangramia salexigens]|uniref:Acyl-CoA dehydrogenase n=1 Tax=Christiangramia salexigens TaxID=1913577 RepID=A0A1L3J2H7_9FLAO|nr:hypothetical protein [Christiangramia salexigens]APG59323.1 hypothetical protein LPB144_02350 [Christiangramia salexigens]
MWEKAINAIKENDLDWIKENRSDFRNFFKEENTLPQGKLSCNALEEHYKNKLFKMFLPSSLGGLAIDLGEGARLLENASRLNGSWGWLLAIGVGGAYFAEYLMEPLRSDLFLPAEALVAGSGKPSGIAVKVGEQWEVNGSWDYCSGSEQASLFTGVTRVDGVLKAIILPKDQVTIHRNWNTIGLKLTCSHTILAENVKIPSDHIFDLSDIPRPSDYPLSNYPFDLFARICFVPVIIGLSKALWVEINNMSLERMPVWQNFQPEKYHKVQNLISDFERKFDSQTANFYTVVAKSWDNHKRHKNINVNEVQKVSLELSKLCYSAGSEILPFLGMEVMNKEHPIQICWKDLRTAYQHMIFRDYSL